VKNQPAVRGLGRALLGTLTAALLLFIPSGCGRDGPERVIVSGTVTYQGQPLEEGRIRFVPNKETKAPISGGFVRDGKYAVDSKGGVPVGTHKISIEAHRVDPNYKGPTNPPPDDIENRPPIQQYLPAKYNALTELEITIEPGSSKITEDFNLTQ